jgi:hypothetical protein
MIAARLPLDVPVRWLPSQGPPYSPLRGAWYGQIPHLCLALLAQAERDVAEAHETLTSAGADVGLRFQAHFDAAYANTIRPFLERPSRSSPLRNVREAAAFFDRLCVLAARPEFVDPVERLQRLCDTRRQLADLRALYRWLDVWRRLHALLTVLLVVLIGVHAAEAWPR